MKKLLAILLVVFMVAGSFSVCMAEGSDGVQAANTLNKLGLFNGTGVDEAGNPVFGLENKLSRQEATALLVRLLGKEAAAKETTFELPFTDVDDWAKPYVGYAYQNGLVNGVGETSFGSNNPISATEYLTLILRVLGYNDKQGDFAWDAAWVLSDQLGMTDGRYHGATNAEFYRNDAVLVSYMSFFQVIQGDGRTLASKLLSENVFATEQLESTQDLTLKKAAGLAEVPEVPANGAQVAAVTGISFEQRGVYVKMTLTTPENQTGIVGYEALIYDKNNPEIAVHRTIKLEDPTAHYRLDDPQIFVVGQSYNTIKVTSNAAEGYAPAYWEQEISVVPVQKDATVTEAWVENADEIDVALAGVESGYLGYIFTRADESVIDQDTFTIYNGGTAKYRAKLNGWSEEDKRALENGEVFVAITGMNLLVNAEIDGKWHVEFERIKAPKLQVKCAVDLVQ